MLTVQS
jgi:hypothetical protein